ncbi:MAG: M3 family metallopeptidase, partial [Nannocystaceae bacterium]
RPVHGARRAAEEAAAAAAEYVRSASTQIGSSKFNRRGGRDRELREQLWRAYNRRASDGETNNAPLICTILRLRREKARLLGYEDFADLVLEDRMAASGTRAAGFVDELHAASADAFARERDELQHFATTHDGEAVTPLRPWDVSYYAELLRQDRFDFDGEQLRPYFAKSKVLEGMFEMVRHLYGVDVRVAQEPDTWNSAVTVYEVYEGTRRLGRFFADLHPRDDKRGGAWMHGLSLSEEFPEEDVGHVGLIAANLTPATGEGPALLDHQEVETLFHEFGHLLHHLLTEVPVRSMAGTNVAWDFVELPSQIMENWCWHRDGLRAFATHHETGEVLPEALTERLLHSRTFRGASQMMRQLGFASLDLALHRTLDPGTTTPEELLAFCRDHLAPFATTELPDDESMICAFNHLFSSATGYAAGYYSYKWAEVLDADAFSAFAGGGLFDREVGMHFRRCILARGDAAPPEELFKDFLGRAPTVGPLLERSGIEVTR